MQSSASGQTTVLPASNTAAPPLAASYSTPPVSASLPAAETTVLAWRIHRLRRNPRLLSLVALAYGVGLFFWMHLFPHPLSLLLPLGALTSSMAEYLFPISYRLTNRGAYVDCFFSRLHLAWSDVRRARYGDDGVFLSPLPHPSRLDTFRGLRLCFADGEEADSAAVLETVRRCRRDFGTSGETAR